MTTANTPAQQAVTRPDNATPILDAFPSAVGAGLLQNPNDLNVRQLDWLMSTIQAMPDLDSVLTSVGLSRKQLAQLETDDEIYAAIETRRDQLISTAWHLEPNGTPNTDYIKSQLDEHMPTLINSAFNAVLYGYSVTELVYKYDVSKNVGISAVQSCPVDWFNIRGDGALMINTNGAYEPCDTEFKFFLTRRNPTYRQPYGEALLTRLFWVWRFRSSGWQYWIQFMERHATPLLVGKSHSTDSMKAALSQIARMALAIPIEDDVQVLTATQSGEFERFNQALNQRIQRTILGQTMTNGADGGGSLAAFKALDIIRMQKTSADIRLITPTLQHIINALWVLNGFGDATTAPRIVFELDTGLQEARATRDAELVKAGILQFNEQYLIRNYDFEAGDFVLANQQGSGTNGSQDKLSATNQALDQKLTAELCSDHMHLSDHDCGHHLSSSEKPNYLLNADPFTPEQMQLERLADHAIEELTNVDDVFHLADIKNAILSATSPEDLESQLSVIMLNKPKPEQQQVLERALFAADVLGFAQRQDGVKAI